MFASNKQETPIQLLHDIWFHVSNYIAPEDVKRYSLICIQSANSTNSRAFWFQIYNRYCKQTSHPTTSELPEHLQPQHLRHCEVDELKRRVIQLLYRRYPPFKLRLLTSHSLDVLVGRTYVTTLGTSVFNCYSRFLVFKLNFPLKNATTSIQKYREKRLDCIHGSTECESEEEYDGVMGLRVRSGYCLNFPYKCLKNDFLPYRLTSIEQSAAVCTNMTKLTLQFVSHTGDNYVSGTFSNVEECEVIPWWHPKFRCYR